MTLPWQDAAGRVAVAAFVGLVAWTVLRCARRPAVAHALFALALLELLTPPLVPLPVALPFPLRSRESAAAPGPTPAAGPFAAAARPATATGTPASASARWPGRAASGEAPSPAATGLSLLAPVLLGSWVTGSLLVALVAWRRARRFARATRNARPAPEPLRSELRALLPRFRLARAPSLAIVDADVPPLVVLVRGQPRILLPARCLAELPPDGVRALLAHELAHVRRRDPWVRLLEACATVVWWWLPVLWWLRAGLRDAEERSCDAWVAAVLPGLRAAYCRALLHVAAAAPTLPVPATASAVRRIRTWKNRLEDVMTRELPHRMSLAARCATVLLAALALPFALPTAAAQDAARPPDVDARLGVAVETHFDTASLDEWTRWLSERTGVPFTIEPTARALDPARTTLRDLRLPPMPARRALKVIEAITDLQFRTNDRGVVVASSVRTTYEIDSANACYVFGAASKCGAFPLEEATTVLRLLAEVGWRGEADITRVMVIRPHESSPLVIEINVREMIQTGYTGKNIQLAPDDIVYVPRRGEAEALPPSKLAVGSRLKFVLYLDPIPQGAEQLRLLREPLPVGRDGTIFVPYVGHVPVLGATQDEVAALVQGKLQPLFPFAIQLHALFLP